MKRKLYITCFVLILLVFIPFLCQGKSPDLRNIPLNSRVYDYLEFLAVNGNIPPVLDGSLPLTYGEFAEALTRAKINENYNDTVKMILTSLQTELDRGIPFTVFNKKFNISGKLTTRYLSELVPENRLYKSINVKDAEHLVFYSTAWTQPYPFLFGETGMRVYLSNQDTVYHIPPAYFKLVYGPVSVEVGESVMRWGPGKFGSLSLADDWGSTFYTDNSDWFQDNPEMDLFKVVGDLGRVKLTYFTGRDDSYGKGEYTHFAPPDEGEPFLSGLRADLQLGDHLRIGAGDVVVSYNPFETDILIKDPLAYFTDLVDSPQGQREENLNLMGTCDLTLTLPGLGRLYGEYIWDSTLDEDDLDSYEAAQSGPKTGWLLGYYRPFTTDNAIYGLRFEHTMIDDTVYTFPLAQSLEYKYKDRWLGHWSGPDSSSTIAEISTTRLDGWEGALRYTMLKKGLNLKPVKTMNVITLELTREIRKNSRIAGYLQYNQGDDIGILSEGMGVGLEYQVELDLLFQQAINSI